jgi:hypothetical protein
MRNLTRLVTAAVAAAFVLSIPARFARAGGVGGDVWLTGGFVSADYKDAYLACIRGGAGPEFLGRFSVGLSGQVDRERYFYFAYAGAVLPRVGMLEPYARFHAGRRDDVDDTALGWSAGVRIGNGTTYLLLEVHGVLEPGHSNGASMGVSF